MFIYRVGASGFISRQSALIVWHNAFKFVALTASTLNTIMPLSLSPLQLEYELDLTEEGYNQRSQGGGHYRDDYYHHQPPRYNYNYG